MDLMTKLNMKKAFLKAEDNKKEIYRILVIAESLGLQWGSRTMYGGGTSITVFDGVDIAVEICIMDDGNTISFDREYFTPDFVPSKIEYYRGETLAEIRNEEALYSYELPHYCIVKGA
jgi:hypothetical protein